MGCPMSFRASGPLFGALSLLLAAGFVMACGSSRDDGAAGPSTDPPATSGETSREDAATASDEAASPDASSASDADASADGATNDAASDAGPMLDGASDAATRSRRSTATDASSG
jgi:hypothetical protein